MHLYKGPSKPITGNVGHAPVPVNVVSKGGSVAPGTLPAPINSKIVAPKTADTPMVLDRGNSTTVQKRLHLFLAACPSPSGKLLPLTQARRANVANAFGKMLNKYALTGEGGLIETKQADAPLVRDPGSYADYSKGVWKVPVDIVVTLPKLKPGESWDKYVDFKGLRMVLDEFFFLDQMGLVISAFNDFGINVKDELDKIRTKTGSDPVYATGDKLSKEDRKLIYEYRVELYKEYGEHIAGLDVEVINDKDSAHYGKVNLAYDVGDKPSKKDFFTDEGFNEKAYNEACEVWLASLNKFLGNKDLKTPAPDDTTLEEVLGSAKLYRRLQQLMEDARNDKIKTYTEAECEDALATMKDKWPGPTPRFATQDEDYPYTKIVIKLHRRLNSIYRVAEECSYFSFLRRELVDRSPLLSMMGIGRLLDLLSTPICRGVVGATVGYAVASTVGLPMVGAIGAGLALGVISRWIGATSPIVGIATYLSIGVSAPWSIVGGLSAFAATKFLGWLFHGKNSGRTQSAANAENKKIVKENRWDVVSKFQFYLRRKSITARYRSHPDVLADKLKELESARDKQIQRWRKFVRSPEMKIPFFKRPELAKFMAVFDLRRGLLVQTVKSFAGALIPVGIVKLATYALHYYGGANLMVMGKWSFFLAGMPTASVVGATFLALYLTYNLLKAAHRTNIKLIASEKHRVEEQIKNLKDKEALQAASLAETMRIELEGNRWGWRKKPHEIGSGRYDPIEVDNKIQEVIRIRDGSIIDLGKRGKVEAMSAYERGQVRDLLISIAKAKGYSPEDILSAPTKLSNGRQIDSRKLFEGYEEIVMAALQNAMHKSLCDGISADPAIPVLGGNRTEYSMRHFTEGFYNKCLVKLEHMQLNYGGDFTPEEMVKRDQEAVQLVQEQFKDYSNLTYVLRYRVISRLSWLFVKVDAHWATSLLVKWVDKFPIYRTITRPWQYDPDAERKQDESGSKAADEAATGAARV